MQDAADATSDIDAHEPVGVGLLETILALMPDAAVVVDDGGSIVCVNEQARMLFGYDDDELTDRSIEALVPERFRSAHRQHRRDYTAAPHARAMGAGRDLVGRRKDGTEFPIDISLAPLGVSDPPLIVAGIRDATERRQAQAAHAELAAVVRSSRDAILSMELDGRIRTCNAGSEVLFGYAATELVGSHISRLVPEDASPDFERHLEAALRGEPLGPFDTRWRNRDGAGRDVAASVSPLGTGPDETIGFAVVLRDITERKHAEIEQRRLLAEVRRQERLHAAQAGIRLALLSDSSLEDDLTLICSRLCDLLDAPAAVVLLLDGGPRIVAGAGDASPLTGVPLGPVPALLDLLLAGTERELPDGLPEEGTNPGVAAVFSHVPVLWAPVEGETEVKGLLLVATGVQATEQHLPIVETMSKQALMALELDQGRANRERLVLVEDRERIARDLHDQVIQRLFAAGLGLQAVLPRINDPRAVERVAEIVEGLDKAITDIRTTIFRLEPTSPRRSVRADVLDLAEEASRPLGFTPKVVFDGPVDAAVSDRLAPHVLAVVREALANVARHAHATRVLVELIADRHVRVIVSDDGVGVGPTDRRSGLANLRSRAEELGGRLVLLPNPDGGTRVEWSVPLG